MNNSQLILSLFIILFIDTGVVQCILNGNITVGSNFKYHVLLWNQLSHINCGGVIIDDLHILTAGHCVYHGSPHDYFVSAGSTDIINQHPVILRIKTIHLHPNFQRILQPTIQQLIELTPYHSANDIAVLTLTERFHLDGPVAAIPLPLQNILPCEIIESCEIAGWGQYGPDSSLPFQLLWGSFNVYGSAICGLIDTSVRDNEICGMDPRGITSLLQGDSGGGLVCDGFLVGIASCTRLYPEFPGIYVNVYNFLSFITDVIRMDQENAEHIK